MMLDKEPCVVCLCEVESKKSPLPCGHWVHRDCVVRSQRPECPCCKHPIILTRSEHKTREELQYLQPESDDVEFGVLTAEGSDEFLDIIMRLLLTATIIQTTSLSS